MEIRKEKIPVLNFFCMIVLFFFKTKAPNVAKIKCVKARSTTTIGKPEKKNPILVMSATAIATTGEINMAMKIGTWLASVKEAGSITIFGANIGIIIPIAHSKAEMVIVWTLLFFIITSILRRDYANFM